MIGQLCIKKIVHLKPDVKISIAILYQGIHSAAQFPNSVPLMKEAYSPNIDLGLMGSLMMSIMISLSDSLYFVS